MAGWQALAKHRALIDRWAGALSRFPEVDAVWLEGSLVDGRAAPGSDIDLRLAIADDAYERLWLADRAALLAGLGECHLLLDTFVRALTADGIVVEAWAHRTGALPSLALHHWQFVFCRLPGGEPEFRRLPALSAAETWPDPEPLTVQAVRDLTNMWLLSLATAPATLHRGEVHSARFVLDGRRESLVRLMYRRVGLAFSKRYQHFSQVLPAPFLADLERTHLPAGSAPLDRAAIAAAFLGLFDVAGRHLQALSDRAGGGFEPHWYARLYGQVAAELAPFLR